MKEFEPVIGRLIKNDEIISNTLKEMTKLIAILSKTIETLDERVRYLENKSTFLN